MIKNSKAATNIPENNNEKTLAALHVGTPGIAMIPGSDMLRNVEAKGLRARGEAPGRHLGKCVEVYM